MFWKNGSARFDCMHEGVHVVHIFDGKNRQVIGPDPVMKVCVEPELTDQQAAPVTFSAEMFAIPEGYRTVDSRLTGLNTEPGITFGTTDK